MQQVKGVDVERAQGSSVDRHFIFFLHFFVEKVFTFSKVPLKGYPLGCSSSQDGNRHHLDDITCLDDRGSPKASFDTMTGEGEAAQVI